MDYDLFIIGAGPAGYSGALHAARAGMEVAIAEKHRPGGTCLNSGCIPSKALRHCADTLLSARDASRFGVEVSGKINFDFAEAAQHRDRTVESLVSGVNSLLKTRKVTVYEGEARLAGNSRIEIATRNGPVNVSAKNIIIAAGSGPSDLPGIKIDQKRIMSADRALLLTELPDSMIIVGGGVFGCEFADLMNAFGVKVTVIEAMERVLLTEDKSTARAVQKVLAGRGIEFITGTAAEEVTFRDELVSCRLPDGREIKADLMVISVGRKPALSGLGLEEAGVEIENGAIKTDESGRTNVPGIWAAGDAIGAPMLAHTATHEMEVVIDNILGKRREFDRSAVPWVTFVRPEVATVGIREDTARSRNIPTDVGRFSYAASGKARCMGETEGSAKVIARKDDGLILGATVIGARAGELVHEISVALKAGMKADDFREIIHAHPTLSEIMQETVADIKGMAVHKAGRR
ncbi:MAG: dihydrolipoyl dehydrogenase [bacterium]